MEKRGLIHPVALTALCLVGASQVVDPKTDVDIALNPDEVAVVESAFDAAALWASIRTDLDLFYAYRTLRGFDADDAYP